MRFLSNDYEKMFMPDSIIEYDNNNIWRKKYTGKDFKPLYDALSNIKA
jgi:hypothetical protein